MSSVTGLCTTDLSVAPITVVYQPSLFSSEGRRRGIFPHGWTVGDMLDALDVEPRRGAKLRVYVDGSRLDPEEIARFVPAPGAQITARHVPGIVGGIVALFAFLQSAFVAAAGAIGIGGTLGFVLGTGLAVITTGAIVIGGAFLLNLGLSAIAGGPDKLDLGGEGFPSAGTPLLRGARNRLAINEPVWEVLGSIRIRPPFVARPFTEVSGRQQFLRFAVGTYGPGRQEDPKIGEEPIQNFNGFDPVVDYEFREGFPSDAPLTLIPNSVIEETPVQTFVVRWEVGEWKSHTLGGDAEELWFTFAFPSGIQRRNENGKVRFFQVHLEIQYRIVGDPTWLSLFAAGGITCRPDPAAPFGFVCDEFPDGVEVDISATGAEVLTRRPGQLGNPDSLPGHLVIGGRSIRPLLLGIRAKPSQARQTYEVRVRSSGKTASTQNNYTTDRKGNGKDASANFGDFTWTAIQRVLCDPPINFQPGLNVAAVRIRATEQLTGVIDTFNYLYHRKVLVYGHPLGSTWPDGTYAETSNPAWLAIHLWRGNATDQPLSPAKIDFPSFERLARKCEPTAGNYVHRFDANLGELGRMNRLDAVRAILRVARASVSQVDGRFSVVIDEEQADPVQVIAARNIKAGSFRVSRRFDDIPDAVRVRFRDRNNGFQPRELAVYNDGFAEVDADTGALTVDATDGVPSAGLVSLVRQDGLDFRTDGFDAGGWCQVAGFAGTTDGELFLIQSVTTTTQPNDTLVLHNSASRFATSTGNGDERITATAAKHFGPTQDLLGITQEAHAFRETRFALNQAKFRPRVFQWEMDWEYLRSSRGDRVECNHDVPMFGLGSGRVYFLTTNPDQSVDLFAIDIDTTLAPGKSYEIKIRRSDRQPFLAAVDEAQTAIDRASLQNDQLLRLETAVPEIDAPRIGDLISFGEQGSVTRDLIITSVAPSSELSARIVAVDHGIHPTTGARVWDSDTEPAPAFDPGITHPQDPDLVRPATPTILEDSIRYELVGIEAGTGLPLMRIYIPVVPRSGDVPTHYFHAQWKPAAAPVASWINETRVEAIEGEIAISPPADVDLIDFRVRAVSAASGAVGTASPWTATIQLKPFGQTPKPKRVRTFVTVEPRTDSPRAGIALVIRPGDRKITAGHLIRWRVVPVEIPASVRRDLGELIATEATQWRVFDTRPVIRRVFIAPEQFGRVEFEVHTVTHSGQVSEPVEGTIDFTPGSLFETIRITGLELHGEGSGTTFDIRSPLFTWRINSRFLQTELGEEIAGAGTGMRSDARPNFLKDYEIRIIDADTGKLIETYYSLNERWRYNISRNRRDAKTLPPQNGARTRRKFTIEVRARFTTGELSAAGSLTVENPAPPAQTITAPRPRGPTFLALESTEPQINDILRYLWWVSETQGFDPLVVSPISRTQGPATVVQVVPGSRVYVRGAVADTLSDEPVALNITPELFVRVRPSQQSTNLVIDPGFELGAQEDIVDPLDDHWFGEHDGTAGSWHVVEGAAARSGNRVVNLLVTSGDATVGTLWARGDPAVPSRHIPVRPGLSSTRPLDEFHGIGWMLVEAPIPAGHSVRAVCSVRDQDGVEVQRLNGPATVFSTTGVYQAIEATFAPTATDAAYAVFGWEVTNPGTSIFRGDDFKVLHLNSSEHTDEDSGTLTLPAATSTVVSQVDSVEMLNARGAKLSWTCAYAQNGSNGDLTAQLQYRLNGGAWTNLGGVFPLRATGQASPANDTAHISRRLLNASIGQYDFRVQLTTAAGVTGEVGERVLQARTLERG